MNTGDIISRYRITGPLGKGGMGVVYIAEDLRLGRPVALKFLPENSLGDDQKKRFLNEARAAAQVRHPNICPIYDIEETGGRCFIAMALIDGETVARRIKRGPMQFSQVVDIGRQIAAGLEAAHASGIVHRDIKSINLMIDPNGHVSILDFGLALRGGEERLTVAGGAVGTPAYMSPEQLRAEDIDARTDIWALGVVIHEMVTAKIPRRDGTDDLLPAGLAPIVLKALEQNRDHRWQSAREMGAALATLSGLAAESQTQTLVTIPSPAKLVSRPMVAAAVLVLALGTWGLSRLGQKPAVRSVIPSSTSPAARRVALLPLKATGDQAQIVSDALMELWADAIGNSHGKIWAVPLNEVRSRNLGSAEEARRVYGVELAIGGTAQLQGDDVRFVVQLTDTSTLKQVAEQVFVYRVKEPLKSKDGAVDAVLQLLSLPTKAPEPTKRDPGAYSAYLEGRGLMARDDRVGNIDRAIENFKRAIAQDPNFALAHAALGEAYWLKASKSSADPALLALALENAQRGVALDPSLALAHIKLGEIYGAMGKHKEGIAELQRALELSPGNADATLELADIYNNQNLFPEAERAYRASIEARPTSWLGPYKLALFLEDRGRIEESIAALREAGSFAPENATVVRNLGRLYRTQGKFDDAVREFQKAIALQPSAPVYNSLGFTYYCMRQYKKSVDALESAIDLDGQVSQYWGNYGASCSMSPEDKGKAVPALRKAIALAEKRLVVTPTSYVNRADLAEWRARLGDAKGALQEVQLIPPATRPTFATRIVMAYELSNKRGEAIDAVRQYCKDRPMMLRRIFDEPALESLRADPAFQRVNAELTAKR